MGPVSREHAQQTVKLSRLNRHRVGVARGGDYKGDGGTRPPNILVGGRIGKCPPPTDCPFNKKIFLVIRHFSGLLQNAYLGEELNGFCIIKIQSLFSFRGAMPP